MQPAVFFAEAPSRCFEPQDLFLVEKEHRQAPKAQEIFISGIDPPPHRACYTKV